MASLLKFDPGIRIDTHFPIELAKVKVDANQLELAILNLAVNARDAMPGAGGVISIAAREATAVEGLMEGKYVALSVSDTGSGMDEETLKHAQEPFFTTKGIGKGTGLGLSMVKGLAEQSGGALVLKSRTGEGTTAEIWLPASTEKAEAPEAAPAQGAPKPAKVLSVLLVDDDLLVLDNIAAMLDDLGHAVVEARSGEEAIALLRRTPKVDLVLTDYAMPGMNGLQLADAVATERPGLPVVLCTGYADLPGGARPHLPRIAKPFDQTALAAVMDEAIAAEAKAGTVVTLQTRRA
jgi:CheY-like chemotaxis protein